MKRSQSQISSLSDSEIQKQIEQSKRYLSMSVSENKRSIHRRTIRTLENEIRRRNGEPLKPAPIKGFYPLAGIFVRGD